MCKIKFICVIAIMAICGLNRVHGLEASQASESEEYVSDLSSVSDDSKANLTLASRTARVLKYPRTPAFTLRRRQPIQIRSRADHYPLRTQIRRVQNGVSPQNPAQRYGYESLKSSKYVNSKGSSLPYSNSAKGTSLRQQLLGVHPNGVHLPALSQQYIQNFKASPAFNGKVVVHPVTTNQQQQTQSQQIPQQQQQQPPPPPQQSQQVDSYPKYVKPQQQQQQQQQHQHQQHSIASQQQTGAGQYPEFKQFPIPDQQQMQKYNEQHEKYLQQQKYLTPRDPLAYYQQQYMQQQQPQHQHLQQQQQQQPYAVHQPPYVAPSKPVAQQYNTQPSIPIHEVSGSSASSSASATSSSSNGQSSYIAHNSAPPPKMYSVYEENDMTELHNNDYQTMQYENLEKEAQEYLRFMNTNEYFLPKRDPNYKQIDEENDRRQQYNLKVPAPQYHQQPAAAVPYAQHQQLFEPNYEANSYQQSQQQAAQLSQQGQHQTETHYGLHHGDTTAAASSAYNQPIQVSKLFYQDDTTYQGEPSTVLRTSYQTGFNSNQFVVSSQDGKASKYLIPPPNSLAVVSTQSPPIVNNIYSQVRQSPQSSRTPEPLRFEFTERDAMVGAISYTNAPKQQLRYKSADTPVTPKLPAVESSTAPTTGSVLSTSQRSQTYQSSSGLKPVSEVDDDPEDDDDMQPAGSNLYGRQPPQNKNKSTHHSSSSPSTTESPPNEQKDTEDYCERICAIVEDEHEEIVCGSDGYMYTSEAQMECYASCLHIDITIQGKGSCSAR